jgi:hypothetical protein
LPVTAVRSVVTYAAIGAAPDASYAITTAGALYAWGDDGSGETNVPSLPSGDSWTAVSGGWDYAIGLDSNGDAWGWGTDDGYQLGTGGTGSGEVTMPAGVRFQSVSASHLGDGQGFTLAVDAAGRLWAWGYNGDGQLGDGTTASRSTPVRVQAPAGVTFTGIAAGGDHSLALDSAGAAWAWGDNSHGQLGDGTTTGRDTPKTVSQPAGTRFAAVSAGNSHSVAALSASPAVPRHVRVAPSNGRARVSWQPPSADGGSPITGYVVTATPQDEYPLIPANGASAMQFTVPASRLSYQFTGLIEDCHQTYRFSVAAVTANGTGPAAIARLPLDLPVITSGIVPQSKDPPLVVVLVDGISSSEPDSFTMNPLQPEGAPASIGYSAGFGADTYCPERPYNDQADSATNLRFLGAHSNGRFSPGMDRFWSKWNFEASLPLDRTGLPGGTPTYAPTNRFMLDPLAAVGAVILPFSYKDRSGATLKMSNGHPVFTFNGYGPIDSCCQDLNTSASLLQEEIISIRDTWPKSHIVLIGHSLGGLVAEWWWQFIASGNPASKGVSHVFSLDSPINGVKDACGPVLGVNRLFKQLCHLWRANYGDHPGLRDEIINGLDANGSFVAFGTRFDPVYDCDPTKGKGCGFPGGAFDVPDPGLLSQVLFHSMADCTDETTSCTPFGFSFISPSDCDVTNADDARSFSDFEGNTQQGTGHFVVKYCPTIAELIRETASGVVAQNIRS